MKISKKHKKQIQDYLHQLNVAQRQLDSCIKMQLNDKISEQEKKKDLEKKSKAIKRLNKKFSKKYEKLDALMGEINEVYGYLPEKEEYI